MLAERQLNDDRRRPGDGNGHRGPSTIDLPGTGYSADTYQLASYIAEIDSLMQFTLDIVAKAQLWLPDVAMQRINKILEYNDKRKTTWIGFRKTEAPLGQYEGLAWQQAVSIPTVAGRGRDIPLLFMILRAFEPQAQGKHFGRTSIQIALHSHPEVTHIAHRTGSPAAIYSWLEAGVSQEGHRSPYDLPFNKVPYYQQMLLWLHDLTHYMGDTPDLTTGVSKHEYPGPNRAYIPDLSHGPTMRIRSWMEKDLRMNFRRGDALYEIGLLKQSKRS